MIVASVQSNAEFLRGFIMARNVIDPQLHGVNLDKDAFTDLMVGELASTFHGQITIDELVLSPRMALKFCDDVRSKHGFHYLPDDIILRAIMIRRKNPNS